MATRAPNHSEVLPLFPTFVWKSRLHPDSYQLLNRQIVALLNTLMPTLKAGQAWQSRQDLHSHAAFGLLVQQVFKQAAAVLAFQKIAARELTITACWATVNAPGRGHRAHSHPNSFLSSVYYVQTQDGANTINFHDPRSQVAIIRPPVTELTAANADQAVVQVANGTLLIFPSWLQHSVDMNASDTVRISVSLNLMFPAYTEELCKPLWGEVT